MEVALSRYARFTPDGGEFLLTSLISRTVIRLPSPLRRLLPQPGEQIHKADQIPFDLLRQLVESLIIIPSGTDEQDLVRRLHKRARANADTLNLTIAPTLDCNMTCHYCFQKRSAQTLGHSGQQRVLEYTADNIDKFRALHVQWFGGEPLLALKEIIDTTTRLRAISSRAGRPFSADVTTNGALLDEQNVTKLAEIGVTSAQITFEGAKKYHEKIRRPSDGQSGSYEKLLKNLKSATRRMNITVRIHVTMTAAESIELLLEELATSGLGPGVKKIYFAPLFSYSQNGRQFKESDSLFLTSQRYAAIEAKLLARCSELGLPTPDPLSASYEVCVALREGALMFGPKGEMHRCYLEIGDDTLSSPTEEQRHQKWDDYDFTRSTDCMRCSFMPICLGGCPKQEMEGAARNLICTPLRYNFDERIRLAYGGRKEQRIVSSTCAETSAPDAQAQVDLV